MISPRNLLSSFKHRKVGKHVIRREIFRLADGRRTLDIGCGAGLYRQAFPNYFGVDVIAGPGVDRVADAHDLPFPDQSFEQIVTSEVIEHLHTPTKAVQEMARVLKPGGRLILTAPFVYPLHEGPHDYQRFTEYGFALLLQPYFDNVEIRPLFNEEQTIAILLQRVVLQRDTGLIRAMIYTLLAHLFFRLGPSGVSARRQGLNGQPGHFLTATYMVTATRRAQGVGAS